MHNVIAKRYYEQIEKESIIFIRIKYILFNNFMPGGIL